MLYMCWTFGERTYWVRSGVLIIETKMLEKGRGCGHGTCYFVENGFVLGEYSPNSSLGALNNGTRTITYQIIKAT